MPSTNDFIRFRNAFLVKERSKLVTTTIAWLEKDVKPVVTHVNEYNEFIAQLKMVQNDDPISDSWFYALGKKFASYPFYDRFLRNFR